MKVTNIFNSVSINSEIDNPISLLSNKNGSYFSVSEDQTSYQGLTFFRNNSMYKLIDSINFNLDFNSVINSANKVVISSERVHLTYELHNVLSLNVHNYSDEISLDLDFRNLYSFPEFGRIYEVFREENIVFIKYNKFTDDSLTQLEDSFFLAIKIENLDIESFKVLNDWIKKDYLIDKKRGYGSERYVNRIISFKIKNGFGKLKISFGESKQKCLDMLESKKDFSFLDMDNFNDLHYTDEIAIAANSLNMNIHTINFQNKYQIKQIFAGWPWFFQFWTRDTLISLGGLLFLKKFSTIKTILDKYLTMESNLGLINSRIPSSILKALDSTGWLFKRYYDFLFLLQKENKLNKYYSKDSLLDLNKSLEKIFNDYIRNNMKNGLIYSGKNETWMDTDFEDSGRSGYCIEIQTLTLSMIKTLRLLSVLINQKLNPRYIDIEKKLILNVRKRFLKEDKLADRITDTESDFTQRPNIFIARYVYPHLFHDSEWEKIFFNALSELWLNWGGLSSISKFNSQFTKQHTGSNNQSYHRGDSWYFVNNIALTQMFLVNKNFFKNRILDILKASLKDMLFLGAVGSCSEISSAKTQTAEGCLNQSWSSSTLIEALFLISDEKSFLS